MSHVRSSSQTKRGHITARKRALKLAELILEKKGDDLLMLDLRRASPVADYFLIVTAQSSLHAQAISDHITLKMKQAGMPPSHVEGYGPAQWILIDFLDVIVHIFRPEVRVFYGLERLWGDMPQKRWVGEQGVGAADGS